MSNTYEVRREAGAPDWGGATLSGESYTSRAVLARELERIFPTTWLLAGPAERVLSAGDYFTCELTGQPVLVVRQSSTEVHAFHNVCRHRGHRLVADAQGKAAEHFTCAYDQWRYGRDGQLIEVPNAGDYPNLDTATCGLLPLQFFVFPVH